MKGIKIGDYIINKFSNANTDEEIKNETLVCKKVESKNNNEFFNFDKIHWETLDGSKKGETDCYHFIKIENYKEFKAEQEAYFEKIRIHDELKIQQLNIRDIQLERFHKYINNDSDKFQYIVNKIIEFYNSDKYDKRFKYDKPYYFYTFLADYACNYGRLTIEKENEKYDFYEDDYQTYNIHGYYIYNYYNHIHIIKEDENITKDILNYLILDNIKKYLDKDENAKHLRFGQVLFNMNINEFANKNNPESEKFLLRDIHNDSNNKILNRIQL